MAKSPIGHLRGFARQRGCNSLRLFSSAASMYDRDYHSETSDGGQLPVLTVFVRRGTQIHHFYSTELLYASRESGQNERHIDMMWPLWNLLDVGVLIISSWGKPNATQVRS